MIVEQTAVSKNHKLVLNNRKNGLVTGVLDVLSFNLNEILLETEQGMLMVKGTDLHVNRVNLEKGEIDLSGNIDSVAYSEIIRRENRQKACLESCFASFLRSHRKQGEDGNPKGDHSIPDRSFVRWNCAAYVSVPELFQGDCTSYALGDRAGRSVLLDWNSSFFICSDISYK